MCCCCRPKAGSPQTQPEIEPISLPHDLAKALSRIGLWARGEASFGSWRWSD
jgi:hypothetical protein